MRPRATLVTALAAATLTLAASAATAVTAGDEPPAPPAMHHGIDLADMRPMHDAMIDVDTRMATHMNEAGFDPGHMLDWVAEGDSSDHRWHGRHGAADGRHDERAGTGDHHDSAWMHD